MPKIPTTEGPQVQPQAAPAVYMNPNIPRGAFGEGLIQGVDNLTSTMGAIVGDMQHRADTTRVESANNELRDEQLKINAWVQSMRGKNAFDPKQYGGEDGETLDQLAVKKLKAKAEALSQDLSLNQKQMFQQAAGRFAVDLHGQVLGHLGQQTQVVEADEFKGTQMVELQNVGLNGVANGKIDEPTITQSLQRSVASIERYAASQGWTPDMKEAAKREAAGRIYGTVVDRLLESHNVDGAKVYFQVHEKEMDPAMVKGIRSKIEETSTSIDVQRNVTKVAASGKDLAGQMDELRNIYADNPTALKEAYIEVEHRFRIQKQTQMLAKQDNEGKLWDYFHPTLPGQKAMSIGQIKRTPEWQSLNGEERNSLLAKWEAFSKRNENDPATKVDQWIAYWNVVTERDKDGKLVYPTLTDNQIRAKMGTLGPQLTTKLINDIGEYRTAPTKVEKVQIDQDLLMSTAREVGLVKGDKPTDKEKAQLGILEAQLKVLQQNSGQQWSYENTKKLIKEMTKPVIIDRENWFQRMIPGDWNERKPLFEVVAEEKNIPQGFISALPSLLRKKNLPENMQLDAADQWQLYYDYKKKGLLNEDGTLKEQK